MNLSIKISGAFLVGAVMMGTAVFISKTGIDQTSSSLENLSKIDQVISSGYEDMYAEGLQTGQALRNVLINPKDEKAKENLRVANEKFDLAMKRTLDAAMDDNLIASLTQLKSNWETDQMNKERVISMIASGDIDGARKLITDTETPSWRVVRSALLAGIASSRAKTSAEVSATIAAAKKASQESLIVSAVGLVLGLLMMIYGVTQMILRLRMVERVMDDIGDRGDLTVHIPTNGSDEFNKLLVRVDGIRSRLAAIAAGVSGGADDLVKDGGLSDPSVASRLGLQLRSLVAMFKYK